MTADAGRARECCQTLPATAVLCMNCNFACRAECPGCDNATDLNCKCGKRRLATDRAKVEAQKALAGMLEYDDPDGMTEAAFTVLWTRAIAAALEVVEGHECHPHEASSGMEDMTVHNHPGQTCAAAIAAELRGLL